MNLIASSVFTNSLSRIPTEDSEAIPKLSLFMLQKGDEELHSRTRILHVVEDLIINIARFAENSSSQAGALLEALVMKSLELRWIVAMAASADGSCEKRPVTWAQLLEMDNVVYELCGALKATLKSPIDFASTSCFERINTNRSTDYNIIALHHMVTSSHHDPDVFFKELDSISVSAQHPAALIKSSDGDGFDGGLKVFASDSKPLYVLFECKSRRESNTVSKNSIPRPYKWSQANGMKAKFDGKIDFVYVYLSTHSVEDCVDNDISFSWAKSRLYCLWGR